MPVLTTDMLIQKFSIICYDDDIVCMVRSTTVLVSDSANFILLSWHWQNDTQDDAMSNYIHTTYICIGKTHTQDDAMRQSNYIHIQCIRILYQKLN